MEPYLRPRSLNEALAALPGRLVIAGGTDVLPARAPPEPWGRRDDRPLLDISALPGLDRVERSAEGWRLGALVTWSTLARAALPPAFDGLRAAALQVGGAQVQNRATVLGNLCNASPAADGVPPLLTLDARLVLASPRGERVLPLAAFLLGPRRTALAPDELALALLLPECGGRGSFQKLGARSHLVISIAMAAARLVVAHGVVVEAALAVGACSAVAQRLPLAEAALLGRAPDPALLEAAHLAPLAPIDDVRASAAYRRHAALVLLRRAMEACA
jgi:N-methylhydantoinase B